MSSNPAMNVAIYDRVGTADSASNVMTLQGTVVKTSILLGILIVTGAYTWVETRTGSPGLANGLAIAGAIGGTILAFVTIFFPKASPITSPIYAACEGLFLGAISASFEAKYPGIAGQSAALSVGVLAMLLLAYGTGIIRATEQFKMGIFAATGAVCVVYLVNMIGSFFGMPIPAIGGSGIIGIGFSLVVVVIASLNLILDFDFIERGVQQQAPKYMEWYGGFSLMVTLVWMYLEILRLLSKLRDRN